MEVLIEEQPVINIPIGKDSDGVSTVTVDVGVDEQKFYVSVDDVNILEEENLSASSEVNF